MQFTKDSNFPRASGAQTPAMQALRPAPGPYRFHLGIGIYGALHAPKPPEQGKIPSYNSLCRALRPVSDPYSRFHLGVGHYGALHTPKPPWFLSGERKEPKLAGETTAPLSVRHNRHARKIFLRGSPHLERKIFPLRGFPRGAVRSLFFLVTTLGTGGVLRGQDSILGWGIMGRCTPPNPRGSFLARERNQSSPGRPRPPYLCATIGTLGKSFLEALHTSSERFFRCADSLAAL